MLSLLDCAHLRASLYIFSIYIVWLNDVRKVSLGDHKIMLCRYHKKCLQNLLILIINYIDDLLSKIYCYICRATLTYD